MAQRYQQLAVTPAVAAAQTRAYGRASLVTHAPTRDPLGEDERAFIAERDSFYLATVSETGWPYVQHRGGPAGFLHVLDDHTLAFADLRGNRQLLTTGNLAANDRVSLFLMDYPRRSRLKILGHARTLSAEEDPALARRVSTGLPASSGTPERLMRIDVVGFDWNCPKYITPRYTTAQIEEAITPLRRRIAELEAQLKATPSS